MGKPSFTPGPWDIAWHECKADQTDVDALNDGTKVGDVFWRLPTSIGPITASHSHWGGILLEVNETDANLIAAAPDLYAALDVMVNHYTRLAASGDCGNWDPATEPQVIAAEAALAKARGESNG